MPMIEVDFETFKAITARRPKEDVSEGDVVRHAMGLPPRRQGSGGTSSPGEWVSEGVRFPVGAKLRHRFRNGKVATAEVALDGVSVNGETFPGLSPAAAYGAGHQANGWQFWEVLQADGSWIKADTLRARSG